MALKLNRVDTINLIRIYGEYECLWNCRKKSYKRNDLRKEAWDAIAIYFGTDVTEIKKKLKYLRTAYVAERRKLEESKRNTHNSTEVYQPKLFYYNDFNYLDSTIVLRKREFSDDDEEEVLPKMEIIYDEISSDATDQAQENETIVWEKCTSAEDYLEEDLPQRDLKRVKLSSQFKLNTYPANSSRNIEYNHSSNTLSTNDVYLAFGNSVGLQLKNLKSINAAKAMAQIQQTLTEITIAEVQ